MEGSGDPMELSHRVQFTFELALDEAQAIRFVQDVARSLSRADFLEDLQVEKAPEPRVYASIPVNAALFGQQRLPFESVLVPTPRGAQLRPLPLVDAGPGWAEVAGRAEVEAVPGGSRVTYLFDIAIHLAVPEPEKWGGRALIKMIEYTASKVLERVCAKFPPAVQAAAREVEVAWA